MTTPRPRRNAMKQAEDALEKLLVKKEAAVDDLTRKVNTAVAERDWTKRLIAMLGQEMPPGMDNAPMDSTEDWQDKGPGRKDV